MFLSPEELAGELLQDGRPRCAEDEEGESRCLPTVFFIGVSKCGTTSLSNWLSRHPRARLVSAQEGYNFFEAHLFDNSPKLWHDTKIAARRARLATLAQHEDTVVDFTPHYSVVAEAPHRIADLYGEGTLKRKGLRFLIVLREPVARTISSWEYKSELSSNETVADATVSPEPGLAALPPPPPLAAAVDATADAAAGAEGAEVVVAEAKAVRARRKLKLVEDRTLPMVLEEGAERVERLSECFKDAADNGLFGREPEVTSCRDSKGPKQCEGNPPCQICNTHTEPWCNPRDYLEEVMFNAHVGKSVYVMQLQRWFNVFGRESFKVVFTEDMAENPLETLTEVLEFLGLDMLDAQGHKGLRSLEEWKDIVGARYNTADRAKKEKLDAQVTPEVVQSMREFFGPYNKALEDLLGRRLPDAWGVAREG